MYISTIYLLNWKQLSNYWDAGVVKFSLGMTGGIERVALTKL